MRRAAVISGVLTTPQQGVAPGDRQWRCPRPHSGTGWGPGSLQKDPIPQDLGPEGPPGAARSARPAAQASVLTKQVIAASLAHSSGSGMAPSCRGGRDGRGPPQGWGGCAPSSPPPTPSACGAPRAEPHVSCFSSFRITREPAGCRDQPARGTPSSSRFYSTLGLWF